MERALLMILALAACATVYAKTGRTYYDDETMARVREKLATEDWARGQATQAREACRWLVEMSDQELWDYIPPPEQLRAINVCISHDCPVCGEEITRKAGHYPWITSRDKPFKLECPVCHGVFPGNDFEPWNTLGKDAAPEEGPGYTDKGVGWLDRTDGRRYYFVSYYIFWQRWMTDIFGGLRSLSNAYLLTGDPVYGHKLAVMLCKIASEYERFDYPTQCYHEGMFGIGGRVSDYIWTTGNDSTMGLAVDAVWPALGTDAKLGAFLAGKGISDPAELLDQKLMRVMIDDILTGRASGNMGMHQSTLCELAITFANDDPARGATTAQMRDWLMSGPGRIEDLLWNGFWREGLGGESSPGYSSGWCGNFYQVAQLLPRLGVDIWSNPKLKKMADIGYELTVAGKFSPSTGDAGSCLGTGKIAWSTDLQGQAFMHYGDPLHAQMLKAMGATSQSLFDEVYDQKLVDEAVARVGPDITWRSRNLGGYGMAIMERGQGDSQRGLSLYYGDATGGHGHFDRLNVEMFAYGHSMMPDDGYPTPFRRPDFFEWRRCDTARHYLVEVDEEPQHEGWAGRLNSFAVAPELQIVDASAEAAAYGAKTPLYRRTMAMVDMSPETSYLVDIFRVRGGRQHDYCFHGPPFPEFSVSGGELGPVQEKGTLAGEDVAYGAEPPRLQSADGAPVDLQRATGLLAGETYGELAPKGWTTHAHGILTQKVGARAAVAVNPSLPAGKWRLLVSIWDYCNGANEVEFSLGGATAVLRHESSRTEGFRWVYVDADCPEPITEITVTSRAVGQSYLLVDRLVLSTDLTLTEPRLSQSVASSGYQGFWNVQRLRPAGMWGATWRKPDEDLSLSLTVPADTAQEVISCLGEPELVPGAPDALNYVLGRNGSLSSPEGLLSRYVSVVEPHKGPAQVQAAEYLTTVGAASETVGLKVTRAGATDLIHSSLTAGETVTWQGSGEPLTVRGEYGLVTLDSQGLQRACLVNGTLLRYGDVGVECAAPPTGKVVAVDLPRNMVTLDAPLPDPEIAGGMVAIFGNERHSTSYTVQRAENVAGRAVLHLGDVLCIVGMGAVATFTEGGDGFTADRDFATYGRTEQNRHAGRWIYNEDKSQALQLTAIEGRKLHLEGAAGDLEAIYTDADGDGRRVYWISDLGPGDAWRLPSVTWIQRRAPGVYAVQATGAAKLTLPSER